MDRPGSGPCGRRPAARASATSAAVRLPLNLSGAMRTRTVFGAVVLGMSDGFRVGGAAASPVGLQRRPVPGAGRRFVGAAWWPYSVRSSSMSVTSSRWVGILAGQRFDGFAGEDAAGPVDVEGRGPTRR